MVEKHSNVRCRHYGGPFEKQLGWCQHHETEAAPDVVSTCSAASRA